VVSVQTARDIVLEAVGRLDAETRPVERALGYFVSGTVVSPSDVPPFDNSAMDGFALRSSETRSARPGASVRLRIIGTTRAGDAEAPSPGIGECISIMTGASIPPPADAVVKIEDVELTDSCIVIKEPVPAGDNIRKAGEDIKESDILLSPGARIRPQEMGVLASLGIASVGVIRKPTVTVLTTGDELVGIDEPLTPGKIRDSNRYSLSGLLSGLGCRTILPEIIPDVKDRMDDAFREALKNSDMVLSTGGVSMGKYDLVRETISSIGKVEFWKVNMKPGKPLLFATAQGRPVFGLPGNPVSCMVSFELFVRPALLKMMGSRILFRDELEARLASSLSKKKGRAEFKRGRMWREGGTLFVNAAGPQGSGILTSLVKANCLVRLPEEAEDPAAGENVSVIPI
jgi:molybdopterin molybdotransferase